MIAAHPRRVREALHRPAVVGAAAHPRRLRRLHGRACSPACSAPSATSSRRARTAPAAARGDAAADHLQHRDRRSATCSRSSSARSRDLRGPLPDAHADVPRGAAARRSCSSAKLVVLAVAGAVFGVVGARRLHGSRRAGPRARPASIRCSARPTPGRSPAGSCSRWRCGRSSGSASERSSRTRSRRSSIVLAFTQFVEPILRFGTSIWEWTARGRPVPARRGERRARRLEHLHGVRHGHGERVETLEWWQGGLVLLGIAVDRRDRRIPHHLAPRRHLTA